MEIALFLKSRACKNFKILCPSVLTNVALYVTLKQVNFFHTVFHDITLKSSFEPWLFAEIISENANLDDSGISLPAFPPRINLKLHNIPVTDKTIKKVISDLDSSKAPGLDYIPMVFLKNCRPELSCILHGVVNMLLKESVLQLFEIAIWCPRI